MNNPMSNDDGLSNDMDTSQPAMMPLGSGDFGMDGDASLDPLSGAGIVKRSYSGVLLITLVVVVAAGGLFSMRFLSKSVAGVKSDEKVTSTVSNFLTEWVKGKDGDMKSRSSKQPFAEVVNEDGEIMSICDHYVDMQVPLNEVQKNPFCLLDGSEVKDPVTADVDDSVLRMAERKVAIEAAGSTLKVTSVFFGSKPMARINNELYRESSEILVDNTYTFVVTEIQKEHVRVTSHDDEFDMDVTLTLLIERQ